MAVRVEHSKVANHRFQARAVAGRGDDGVRFQPARAADHLIAFETGDPRHDLDAPRLELGQETDIDEGDVSIEHARRHAGGWRGDAISGEVADYELLHQQAEWVNDLDRQRAHQDPEVLRGDSSWAVTPDDVGRSANGDPHLAGAALDQVGCDLGTRIPRADDKDVAAAERRRVAVGRRVDELADEGSLARPIRQPRSVIVAGRDDNLARVDLACTGGQAPAGRRGLDALDAHSQPDR